MTSAPTRLTITNTETTIDIVYAVGLTAPVGAPGAGFSIKVNGTTITISDADLVTTTLTDDTVRLTVPVISDRDTVLVSYDDADGGIALAADFTDQPSDNGSLHAGLVSAVVDRQSPSVVRLIFSLPVAPAGEGAVQDGLSVKINGSDAGISTVSIGTDTREIHILLSGTIQDRDVVTVSYDAEAGTLTSGYVIQSITDYPVTNGSVEGAPSTTYPLSSIILEEPIVRAGGVEATCGLELNSVDTALLVSYGPKTVDFGGTFGEAELLIRQDLLILKDGLRVTKRFVSDDMSEAAEAAAEWLDTVRQRVATTLQSIRTLDSNLELVGRSVQQV